jgi:tetratricopeptide (TPR) repeat protein
MVSLELIDCLENYRSTTLDCAAALRLNPTNIKAYYRSASALFALDKILDALDVASRGAKLDPENAALKKLLDQIRSRARVKEAQDRRRLAEEKRRQQEAQVLTEVLQSRKVTVRGTKRPPNLDDVSIRLSPDPLSATSLLEFPVMLLYPMHNQTDLIKAWAEKDAITHHLSYILPLPWDTKSQYKQSSVECYMDTISGGLMKVGKKLTLLEALSNGKTEVVDGLVRIYVVPNALAAEWIEDVKKKKGKQ